jgi:hypothetical protein
MLLLYMTPDYSQLHPVFLCHRPLLQHRFSLACLPAGSEAASSLSSLYTPIHANQSQEKHGFATQQHTQALAQETLRQTLLCLKSVLAAQQQARTTGKNH